MDRVYEQRLRDEVIYLHSLWHQGPPKPTRRHLHAPQPTQQFKKNPRRKSTANSEWPCPAASPPTTGWPTPQPQIPPTSPPQLAAGIRAQRKALKAVHGFFNADDSSSNDMDSSSDDDDEGRDAYSFFNKLFKEDANLRECYEKGFANGEFSCMVCGALGGKKTLKKFRGCLPLVQHSIASNKMRKRAHRAFGQALCKLLGWDLHHLPAIVSMLSEQGKCSNDNKASSSMALVSNLDSLNNDTSDVGKINDEAVPESGCMASGYEGNTNPADAVNNLEDCASDGLPLGNISGDNKESSSMAVANNFNSLNSETIESKPDEAAPDSGYMGSGISLHGDEGDMNSMTCPNAGKNLEDCGVVQTQNVESASDGLAINSLTIPDTDGNMENLGMVMHEVEEPASQGLTVGAE